MKSSSAASPPLAIRPSSQAKPTKHAMTRASVTSGVRSVGFASRRGSTSVPGQGFRVGFLVGLGVAFVGPVLALALGEALAPALGDAPGVPPTLVRTV